MQPAMLLSCSTLPALGAVPPHVLPELFACMHSAPWVDMREMVMQGKGGRRKLKPSEIQGSPDVYRWRQERKR